MKLRFYLIIGTMFILGGLLLNSGIIIDYLQKKSNSSSIYAQSADADQQNNLSNKDLSGTPEHIEIPELSISLPVRTGSYDRANETWTLSKDSAYFAVPTAAPNTKGGNTFIYGHRLSDIFKNLPNVKHGDKAIVKTSNGHFFIYQFSKKIDTNPDDVSLFTYTGKPILTLQTCSGLFDQNRSLFVFELVGAR